MKTIKKVTIIPVYVQYCPEVVNMVQNEIYISKEYETSIHLCLCGCKKEVVVPINETGWKLIEKNNKVSFKPSIGLDQYECKSHYVITDNIANFI